MDSQDIWDELSNIFKFYNPPNVFEPTARTVAPSNISHDRPLELGSLELDTESQETRVSTMFPMGGAPPFSMDSNEMQFGAFPFMTGTTNLEDDKFMVIPDSQRDGQTQQLQPQKPPSHPKSNKDSLTGYKERIVLESVGKDPNYLLLKSKDVQVIEELMNKIKTPNNFSISHFQKEDEMFEYEWKIVKPYTVSGHTITYQYHPIVRRLPKKHWTANGMNPGLWINYLYDEASGKFKHVLSSPNRRKKRRSRKPRESSEGLCPYCKEILFAEFKNSNYLHHLNKQHGVFSNGLYVPTPKSYGEYLSVVDDVRIECVECADCSKIIPLSDKASDEKKLLGYLRHYSDMHKKGSKIDLKSKSSSSSSARSSMSISSPLSQEKKTDPLNPNHMQRKKIKKNNERPPLYKII